MVVEGLVLNREAPVISAIGLRTYLEITDVSAPSEAEYGDSVLINVRVLNKHTASIHVALSIGIDGFEDIKYAWLSPGAWNWPLRFTMPDKSVSGTIGLWYEIAGGEWYQDDSATISIALKEVLVGWQLLDSTTLRVDLAVAPPVGWQLLDTRALNVGVAVAPPVGWQHLATTTLAVTSALAPPVGWQLLDSTTVGIAAGPFPDWWELIEHNIYYWGYTYQGDAEVCTFTFKFPPEQIPGVEWLGKKLIEICASTLEDHDSKLLELKLWRDTRPVMWTDYRCEITASASPLVWWAILAIVIGVIVAITFLIREIRKTWYEPHGLPEKVKAGYSRETLIVMICDTEPKEVPEGLEGMTDDELRKLLNQKLAAAAPKPWPWYMWLGIAGLGIAGSFVAVTAMRTFAPAKKE